MSEDAERERAAKRGWAAPGGAHDWTVRILKIVLPMGVGVFLAYLLLSPLSENKEVSFLLDKNKVDVAHERLKTQSAQYRGVDDRGRPFVVDASKAVQATSSVPVIDIAGMSAEIQLKDGPATISADRAKYHMDQQKADVLGPVVVSGANGYRLETRDVNLDFNTHRLAGANGVQGKMPLGRFSAGTLAADLPNRQVTLGGRAHLHIDQGGLRRTK